MSSHNGYSREGLWCKAQRGGLKQRCLDVARLVLGDTVESGNGTVM